MQLWNWRGIDVVNAHERDPEIYKRGGCWPKAGLTSKPLITHTFPLAQEDRTFRTLRGAARGIPRSRS